MAVPAWLRWERNNAARHERDVPKAKRMMRPRREVRAMDDPMATLGHAPRGRKGGRR